jgi:hypothetical protein
MKVPDGATGVTVYYGEVYIESPGYPEDERGTWTVWDPRPVRQGARLIESGLTFRKAEAVAKKLTEKESEAKR